MQPNVKNLLLTLRIEPLLVSDKNLTVVQNAKILGLTISNNLTWNTHTGEIIKKGKQTHVLSCTSPQGRCPIVEHCEFFIVLV